MPVSGVSLRRAPVGSLCTWKWRYDHMSANAEPLLFGKQLTGFIISRGDYLEKKIIIMIQTPLQVSDRTAVKSESSFKQIETWLKPTRRSAQKWGREDGIGSDMSLKDCYSLKALKWTPGRKRNLVRRKKIVENDRHNATLGWRTRTEANQVARDGASWRRSTAALRAMEPEEVIDKVGQNHHFMHIGKRRTQCYESWRVSWLRFSCLKITRSTTTL